MAKEANRSRGRASGRRLRAQGGGRRARDEETLDEKAQALVRAEVKRAISRVPKEARTAELAENLTQAGRLGVLMAARKHDPHQSSLTTYARKFVRGQIMDALRREAEWATHTEELPGDDEVTTKLPRSLSA